MNLAKENVDFVILDEIHTFLKKRDEESSQRRKNLDGLMKYRGMRLGKKELILPDIFLKDMIFYVTF